MLELRLPSCASVARDVSGTSTTASDVIAYGEVKICTRGPSATISWSRRPRAHRRRARCTQSTKSSDANSSPKGSSTAERKRPLPRFPFPHRAGRVAERRRNARFLTQSRRTRAARRASSVSDAGSRRRRAPEIVRAIARGRAPGRRLDRRRARRRIVRRSASRSPTSASCARSRTRRRRPSRRSATSATSRCRAGRRRRARDAVDGRAQAVAARLPRTAFDARDALGALRPRRSGTRARPRTPAQLGASPTRADPSVSATRSHSASTGLSERVASRRRVCRASRNGAPAAQRLERRLRRARPSADSRRAAVASNGDGGDGPRVRPCARTAPSATDADAVRGLRGLGARTRCSALATRAAPAQGAVRRQRSGSDPATRLCDRTVSASRVVRDRGDAPPATLIDAQLCSRNPASRVERDGADGGEQIGLF